MADVWPLNLAVTDFREYRDEVMQLEIGMLSRRVLKKTESGCL